LFLSQAFIPSGQHTDVSYFLVTYDNARFLKI
jgi:hypothetical protein